MEDPHARSALDSVKLTTMLALAGAGVLIWTPLLLLWTVGGALRDRILRGRARGRLSPAG